MSATTLIVTPRVSEQTYQLSSTGVYVFNAPKSANKLEIKNAIQSQYEQYTVQEPTSRKCTQHLKRAIKLAFLRKLNNGD